jgi:hypothetical protein
MNEHEIEEFKKINEKYRQATSLRYGTPDQYQFRQNELMHALARFILEPYWKYEEDKEE